MRRRDFLAATGAATAGGIAGCSGTGEDTDTTTPTDGSPGTETTDGDGERTPDSTGRDDIPSSVGLDPLVQGLSIPLDMAIVSDLDITYVAEQTGLVHVVESGSKRGDPLLDFRDRVTRSYEAGLLGLALHPDFASNRRLFVRYSAPPREDTPRSYSHTFVLSEFAVTADGRSIEPDSERVLLEIPEPQSNHNAGSIEFGPDGYLHVGVGDGGAGGRPGPRSRLGLVFGRPRWQRTGRGGEPPREHPPDRRGSLDRRTAIRDPGHEPPSTGRASPNTTLGGFATRGGSPSTEAISTPVTWDRRDTKKSIWCERAGTTAGT